MYTEYVGHIKQVKDLSKNDVKLNIRVGKKENGGSRKKLHNTKNESVK